MIILIALLVLQALCGIIMSEEALIALYVSLTGSTEGLARSVVIYLEGTQDQEED